MQRLGAGRRRCGIVSTPHPDLRAAFEIDIRVRAPSVRRFRFAQQLADLSRIYEKVLTSIRARGSEPIHLVSTPDLPPGPIAFGRAYNPRMNLSLALCEYRRDADPPYESVLSLDD